MRDNIITAAASATGTVVTQSAYQYDYGLRLEVTGIELPAVTEWQFANSASGAAAKTTLGDSTGCDIPNDLLISGEHVYAWLFIHETTNDGFTVYTFDIPVIQRTRPVEEEPTPEQAGLISQAIAALNEAVEDTTDAKEAAETAATDAAASAVAAGNHADAAEAAEINAQNYATDAQGYANAASASAGDAEGFATAAATSETNAASSATSAADNATAAGLAKDSASASATSAAGYATSASASATTAGEKAVEASASATAAAGSATAASGSADDASDSAIVAAGAATDASASATTAAGSATSAANSATAAAGSATAAAQSAATAASTVSGAIGAIEAKGAEVIESIPEDYTELSADVTQLKSDLNSEPLPSTAWENGTYNVGSGSKGTANNRLRTKDGIPASAYSVSCWGDYQILMFCWDSEDNYLGVWESNTFKKSDVSWQTNINADSARTSGAYTIKIQCRRSNNANISSSDAQPIRFNYSISETAEETSNNSEDIGKLESILDLEIDMSRSSSTDWEQGALQISNGTDTTNSARIRTVSSGIGADVTSVLCGDGYVGYLSCWSNGVYIGVFENDSFIKSNVSWGTNWDIKMARMLGADIVRLVVKRSDGNDILPGEGTNIIYKEESSVLDRYNIFLKYLSIPYANKRISILGDSISTFGGSVSDPSGERYSPEGNPYTYPGNRCRYPQTSLGVTEVSQTYWMQLITALDMVLGINDSWASTRVSWDGTTESTDIGANKYIASQTRIGHLDDNGTPDYILVNAGTNDIIKNVTIGTIDTTDPSTIEDFDNLPVATFADAYRTLLVRLMHSYSNARIVCLLPNFAMGYGAAKQDKYIEIIKQLCDMYGIPYLDMRVNGVTPFNKSTYLGDGLHYNARGMKLVADELIRQFLTSI